NVLHLQSLSTLGRGSLHRVDLVRGTQRAQLGGGAGLPLIARAAMQRVLGHSDGEGQVAAHAAHDYRCADVTRLDLHLTPRSGAAALRDGQAAALAAAASTVLKGQWQVIHDFWQVETNSEGAMVAMRVLAEIHLRTLSGSHKALEKHTNERYFNLRGLVPF
uniref:Uncharacterized protein n=1 Tax=Hippocampus comes TaxID=109280 RepID=A0A3Q3DPZ0_HIPCM